MDACGEFRLRGVPAWAKPEIRCAHPGWPDRHEGFLGVPAGTRGLEIRLSRLEHHDKRNAGSFLQPWPAP